MLGKTSQLDEIDVDDALVQYLVLRHALPPDAANEIWGRVQ